MICGMMITSENRKKKNPTELHVGKTVYQYKILIQMLMLKTVYSP